jgi:hypothetical protein
MKFSFIVRSLVSSEWNLFATIYGPFPQKRSVKLCLCHASFNKEIQFISFYSQVLENSF